MSVAERPDPGVEAPPGYELVVHKPPSWRIQTGHPCRANRGGCKQPCVAAMNRGINTANGVVDCWWAYCGEHLYGKWIEDGEVVGWKMEPVKEPAK